VSAILLASALAPTAARAERRLTIMLEGLPSRLVLPFAEGTNRILTARVKGGSAAQVWLARKADDKGRVALDAVDTNRFQVNLADPDIYELLLAKKGKRKFRIFARAAGGKAYSSVAVLYSLREASAWDYRLWVVGKSGKQRVSRYHGSAWFAPDEVRALECKVSRGEGEAAVSAAAGAQKFAFSRDGAAFKLKITAPLRRAWAASGTLKVRFGPAGEPLRTVIMRAIPGALDLAGGKGKVTVNQRRSADLPGSGGYLRIYIGDISAGQVRVEVSEGHSGAVVVKPTHLQQGGRLRVKLGKRSYTLTLASLVNLLVGTDYAVFEVTPGWTKAAKKPGPAPKKP